jgi:glycerol uptake facilitator-like aquaporin
VPILIFAPISGAHFNPAVSIAFALQRELLWSMAAGYIAAQIIGAVVGGGPFHV